MVGRKETQGGNMASQGRNVYVASKGQGSSVHGRIQARILEWAASPFSRGPSLPLSGRY